VADDQLTFAELFGMAAEACRNLFPVDLGPFAIRPRSYGLKAWFGTAEPGREHFEAQVVGARHVPGATALAIEIGFHAEHPKLALNEAVVDALLAVEPRWRPALGDEAVVGPFLGRADLWRRVSECWVDPDLRDDDLPVEVALRLTDYVTALEPVLRSR
jgi:hypothetical protein